MVNFPSLPRTRFETLDCGNPRIAPASSWVRPRFSISSPMLKAIVAFTKRSSGFGRFRSANTFPLEVEQECQKTANP